MKFTKMHGLGNDYIYVNGAEERVTDPAGLVRVVSDRHTGIGSDGLILMGPSDTADVRMEMYNADGSRAEMCGNGVRCVAKYAVEHGLATGPDVRIETDAGLKLAVCRIVDGKVRSVRVDMGRPSLSAKSIPANLKVDRLIDYPLTVPEPRASARADVGTQCAVTCVSIGNPHAVIFVDDLDAVALETVGPRIKHAREFPQRINVHFVRVDSPEQVTMRTWERGSGVTRACGTGACAVCVAGAITDRTRRRITATLPGGDLEIDWADDDHVYLTGPAVEVFSGEWPH